MTDKEVRMTATESGLPLHLPMPVTAAGQGPADQKDAHHLECWCSDPECMWTTAFQEAAELGVKKFLATPKLEARIAYALAKRHKCLEHAGPRSGPCKTDQERAALIMALLSMEAVEFE